VEIQLSVAAFETDTQINVNTYQFKTYCKGDSHSSKTANTILPEFVINKGERPYVYLEFY